VTGPPLVPSPLYGLRTWTVVGGRGEERLAGPQQPAPWPADGAWLTAGCARDPAHSAPAPGCQCGIHAWHPRPRSARRVLSLRRQVAGVVEARGAVELHRDGFRAEQARPFALFLAPGAQAALVGRLAQTYAAEVVPARAPGAVVDWCRARGTGLDPGVVDELLGPERLAERRRRVRLVRLRAAAALVVLMLAVAIGLAATGDPGDRTLSGRTGEVRPR
jgi:hypothetical protein